MRLEIYPACLDCPFSAFAFDKVMRSYGDEVLGFHATYEGVTRCGHLPICNRVEGQQMITADMFEGGKR